MKNVKITRRLKVVLSSFLNRSPANHTMLEGDALEKLGFLTRVRSGAKFIFVMTKEGRVAAEEFRSRINEPE